MKPENKTKRTTRPLTAEESARRKKLLQQLEVEKPRIKAQGAELRRQSEAAAAAMQKFFRELRKIREDKGFSLADLERLTGINKPNLSRLETSPQPGTTFWTMWRLAAALDKDLSFGLVDK